MELELAPETEQKLKDIAALSGLSVSEVVDDAVAAYGDGLAQTRETLDRRYDEIKSGKVKLIPGEEVEAHFRQKYQDAKLKSGS